MWNNPAFKTFIFLYIPILILGAITVLFLDKGTMVLAVNAVHEPRLDEFVKCFTFLGDGLFLGIIILVLLFVNRKYAVLFMATGVGQLIVSVVLKKIVFGRTIRPAIYIGEHLLHFVEGVKVAWWYSFPSGHTITAFSSFFLVALLSRSRIVAVICLVVAVGVAFSRIYLVLHFVEDVVAGSLIGVLLTMFFYSQANKWDYFESI